MEIEIFSGYCRDSLVSKSSIDKIGERLAKDSNDPEAIRIAQCYRIFRLLALPRCLKIVDEANIPEHSLVSARLKRMDSIIRKIEKGQKSEKISPELSNMDDIIGIRIVCDYANEGASFSDRLQRNSNSRVKDYTKKARDTGYRAQHHIIKIQQDIPNGNKATFRFEVQVRSYYQHQWAIWSEWYGDQVKEGKGSDEVIGKLLELSNQIKDWENENKCKRQNNIPKKQGELLLALVRRQKGGNAIFHRYGLKDTSLALEHLFKWEKDRTQEYDALLLAGMSDSAELFNCLAKTHPIYFHDVLVPNEFKPETE